MENHTLQRKIDKSIELIRKGANLSLSMDNRGYHVAFSGGKDSQVLLELVKYAGVEYHAEMEVTTLDTPELMRFVREHYPDVQKNLPKMNFFELIKHKKSLPLRGCRYCCEVLKEGAGAGTVVLDGVTRFESARRAKREEVERFHKNPKKRKFSLDAEHSCVGGKDKITIHPIFNWTQNDVWTFIRSNGIKYCSLYDEGFHRIGCVFCPISSDKTKVKELRRYPKYAERIKQSIQYLINEHDYFNNHNATADEVFMWWISNKSADEYFARRKQLCLF